MHSFFKTSQPERGWRQIHINPNSSTPPCGRVGHSFVCGPTLSSLPETFFILLGSDIKGNYLSDIWGFNPQDESYKCFIPNVDYEAALQIQAKKIKEILSFYEGCEHDEAKMKKKFGNMFESNFIIKYKGDQSHVKELYEQVVNRQYHVTVVAQNKIYVFGGQNNNILNDLIYLDLSTLQWSRLDISLSAKNKPSQRYGSTGTYHHERLYIFGGYVTHGLTCNDMWYFDIQQAEWHQVRYTNSAIPASRFHHSASSINGYWLIGFGKGDQGPLNDMWQFDFESFTWTQLTWQCRLSPKPRWGHAMTVSPLENVFFVEGGKDAYHYFSDLWKYSIADSSWVQIKNGLLQARSFYAGDYSRNRNVLYFFGGSDSGGVVRNDLFELWDISNISGLNDLPFDLGRMIFRHLGLLDLARCSKVCRRWRDITYREEELWKCFVPFFENSDFFPQDSGLGPREKIMKYHQHRIESFQRASKALNFKYIQQRFQNWRDFEMNAAAWERMAVSFRKQLLQQLKGDSQIKNEIKVVAVGNGAVGKTTIFYTYVQGSFPDSYLCYEVQQKKINIEGHSVELGLWDTEGQEDYDRLRPLSYPGTDVFVIIFSLVDPASLESVSRKWVPEITKHCPNTPFILVGNKSDLRTDFKATKEIVTLEEGRQIARKIGALSYFDTSAKTPENLDELFECAGQLGLIHQNNLLGVTEKKKKDCLVQ